MNATHDSGLLPASDTSVAVTRGGIGSTVAEDPSFINVREIGDWCKECREYRPPILAAATLFGLSFGALLGFLPAYVATDAATSASWRGAFLMASVLSG